jgi:hypothetical protein
MPNDHGNVFSEYQPRYAAVGIPTFPCHIAEQKKPLVRNYQRMGLPASHQLVMKGFDGKGLACMAGQRNKLTVVDIDAHGHEGERLLEDAQYTYGRSRFIVRTGSGGFHAYYRYAGEARRIRPDPRQPIDLLGAGVVILPPSLGAERRYEIIEGHIDDLPALTPLRRTTALQKTRIPLDAALVAKGTRGVELWRHCMRAAHHCDDLETLIDVARTRSEEMLPPIENDVRIINIARSAWGYTERGENRFGRTGAWFETDEINSMLASDQDGFVLLAFLRANNRPKSTFMVPNALATSFGWTRKRLASARRRLAGRHIVMVRAPSDQRGAALYRWWRREA